MQLPRPLSNFRTYCSSWIFGVLNPHLEVRELFPLLSGLSSLEINIFHISYNVIFYLFLFHFNISCQDQPGLRETKTHLAPVFNFRT